MFGRTWHREEEGRGHRLPLLLRNLPRALGKVLFLDAGILRTGKCCPPLDFPEPLFPFPLLIHVLRRPKFHGITVNPGPLPASDPGARDWLMAQSRGRVGSLGEAEHPGPAARQSLQVEAPQGVRSTSSAALSPSLPPSLPGSCPGLSHFLRVLFAIQKDPSRSLAPGSSAHGKHVGVPSSPSRVQISPCFQGSLSPFCHLKLGYMYPCSAQMWPPAL